MSRSALNFELVTAMILEGFAFKNNEKKIEFIINKNFYRPNRNTLFELYRFSLIIN